MIKFFRKIRYELMEQNKTSKYFKYAIGEIILVVIGILIALQINNWNEAKKAKQKEELALLEILSDLEYSITDLERVRNKDKTNLLKSINSLNILIDVLQTNQVYHDSLSYHFSRANGFDTADFKISGYNSLTSIGMDLIRDTNIRSLIGEFYTSTIRDYNAAYIEIERDFHEYMLDYMRKDFTLVNMQSKNRALVPNDYESLKKNKEYIQSLRTFLDVNNYYLQKLDIIMTNAKQLKKNIEDYIND